MIVLAALASMLPATRKPAPGSPREPEAEREPLPWLPGARLSHSGQFVAVDEESPCLPVRARVALRLAGAFVGAVLLEVSRSGGESWLPLVREDRPVVLAVAGALCVGGFAFGDGPAFVRARCMSLTAGPIGWQLSSW